MKKQTLNVQWDRKIKQGGKENKKGDEGKLRRKVTLKGPRERIISFWIC